MWMLWLGLIAAPEVAFQGEFPVTSPDQVYALEEVERGDVGVGYTVFSGDRLESFDVEVLGIMEDMLGPDEDVILARLSGERIEFTGVIAGMSGSPVYIDGRLVGAVAYRFGSFSKEPIAGITPIARMLAARDAPAVRTAGHEVGLRLRRGFRPEELRASGPVDWVSAPVLQRGPGAEADAAPIGAPISAQGFGGAAVASLAQRLSSPALGPVHGAAAPASSPSASPRGLGATASGRLGLSSNVSSSVGATPALPIGPGSPIAAMLVDGDKRIAAIGTVTYVHGDDVVAFGHPFVGFGSVSFPMATAGILNTLASDAGSYKQGIASLRVGRIGQDRLTAITGDIGRAPEMVPVEVELRSEAGRRRVGVEIVEDPIFLPVMLETVILDVLSGRVAATPGGTVDVATSIRVSGRELRASDRFSGPAPSQIAALAARDAASMTSILARNDFEEPNFEGIRVVVDSGPRVAIHEVVGARLRRRVVAPKEMVEADVVLRSYRGQERTERIRLRVPSGFPRGKARLFVGGGLELERIEFGGSRRVPADLGDLVEILDERRPGDRLYAALFGSTSGRALPGRTYAAAPASLSALLDGSPQSRKIDRLSGPVVERDSDGVVQGGVELEFEIRERP
jgi:hypothetical protein